MSSTQYIVARSLKYQGCSILGMFDGVRISEWDPSKAGHKVCFVGDGVNDSIAPKGAFFAHSGFFEITILYGVSLVFGTTVVMASRIKALKQGALK